MMVEEFTSLPSLPDLDGVVPTSDLDMNFDFNAFAVSSGCAFDVNVCVYVCV